MFDAADPLLARVRGICLALPEAGEKISHGRPVFHTRKVFAHYGGSLRVDGEWVRRDRSILVLAPPGEREALRRRADSYVPAYLGPSGWTGLDLDGASDWEWIRELIVDSYTLTAPTRLARLVGPDTGF